MYWTVTLVSELRCTFDSQACWANRIATGQLAKWNMVLPLVVHLLPQAVTRDLSDHSFKS